MKENCLCSWLWALARVVCCCVIGQVPALVTTDCRGSPLLDVKRRFLCTNELRLILETTVEHQSILPDAPTKTSDSKGWLVCIDLSSSRPLSERARVYGPLWDTPTSHTGFGGLIFTEADRKAAMLTPFVAFDHEGNLVRIVHSTSSEVCTRSMLSMASASAVWKRQPPFSPPPETIAPRSADVLQTPSHRYELRRGIDGNILASTSREKASSLLRNEIAHAARSSTRI